MPAKYWWSNEIDRFGCFVSHCISWHHAKFRFPCDQTHILCFFVRNSKASGLVSSVYRTKLCYILTTNFPLKKCFHSSSTQITCLDTLEYAFQGVKLKNLGHKPRNDWNLSYEHYLPATSESHLEASDLWDITDSFKSKTISLYCRLKHENGIINKY